MKQKIEDIKLLIKNDRRIWAGAGFILLVLMLVWATSSGDGRVRPQKRPESFSKLESDGHSAYKDLREAFNQKIEASERDRDELRSIVTRLETKQDEFQNTVSATIESVAEGLEYTIKRLDQLEKEQKAQPTVIPGEQQAEPLEQDGLEPQWFETTDVPPPPKKPEPPARVSIISPGDSVGVKLLTGVNAPVDGTPYPVVFKLAGPITGPDGSTLELGEARLLAAAQGSEADGRALFRLTSLAIRHKDGRRSVVNVDGWIVGEDGVRGMKGKLIDKLGRLIVATAGVSFGAALADRIDDRNDELADILQDDVDGGVTINGSDVDIATASAFTDASNRLGQILLDRYEKLVPVVEVLSGREVVAIFSSSSEIEVINDYGDEGIYNISLD